MIAEPYILHWRDSFPWAKMHNVEQDLLISRAVVAIYSDEFLASQVTAYRFEEMLGTKFNAVFGRKKTRDLFDMDYVFRHSSPNVDTILRCWRRYKKELGEELPSWREYVQNVEAKLNDEAYRNGMATLLRPGTPFDPDEAWANVRKHIVDRLMTPRDLREMKKGVKVSGTYI